MELEFWVDVNVVNDIYWCGSGCNLVMVKLENVVVIKVFSVVFEVNL